MSTVSHFWHVVSLSFAGSHWISAGIRNKGRPVNGSVERTISQIFILINVSCFTEFVHKWLWVDSLKHAIRDDFDAALSKIVSFA